MVVIFQMTFSIVFYWMEMYELRLKFHRRLILGVQLKFSGIGSDNGLVSTRWQAIIWSNDGLGTDAASMS